MPTLDSSRGSVMQDAAAPMGPADGRPPAETDEFLDQVFEDAVLAVESGALPDLDRLVAGHEDLRAQVEKVVALARQVAPVRPTDLPKVPGFTVESELGRGSMGSVFLARQDRIAGRLVALKVLSPAMDLSARARDRFRLESAAISRLGHPNIVRVLDVVDTPEVQALAMELVAGTTLADDMHAATAGRRRSGRRSRPLASGLSPRRVCEIGAAIGRALDAVHGAGLLHRDVKPSNILLREDGVPLLSDFGLARDVAGVMRTDPGQFVGTAAYAPPEQQRGTDMDPRTDVYALGATLYHAASGRVPWSGSSPADILRQMESAEPPRLRASRPDLPRDLETVLAKAMEFQPARRYATAGDLADDLQRILDHRPIAARPASAARRALLALRRHRRQVIGAGVGVVATVVIVALGLLWWVLLPAWTAREVRAAHLAMLDPEQSDAWYAGAHLADRDRTPLLDDAGLERALGHYQAAAGYLRMPREQRLEYEAVRLAAAIRQGRPVEVPAWVARVAPQTADYAQARSRGVSPDREHASSPLRRLDQRTLGLLAVLTGDMVEGVHAWTTLPVEDVPDPLVETSLAKYCLAVDQPERALAYAATAYRAFPGVGFVAVTYADAAVRVGDLDLAERLLGAAGSMDGHDSFQTLERVRADLQGKRALSLRAQGHTSEADSLDAAARRQFEYYRRERINGTARDHYGQFLLARNELREAAQVYAETVRVYPSMALYREKFRDAADRWWASLPVPERLAELRRMLDGDPFLFEVLFLYQGGLGPQLPLRPRPTSPPDRNTPDAYAASISLGELGVRLHILDIPRWGHCHEYPPAVREALVWLWMLPLPSLIADTLISAAWPGSPGVHGPTLAASRTENFDGRDFPAQLHSFAEPPELPSRVEFGHGVARLSIDPHPLNGWGRSLLGAHFALEGDFEVSVFSPPAPTRLETASLGAWWVTPAGSWGLWVQSMRDTPKRGQFIAGGSGHLPDMQLRFSRTEMGAPAEWLRIRRLGRVLLIEAAASEEGPWTLADLAFGERVRAPARAVIGLQVEGPVTQPAEAVFDRWEIRAERFVDRDRLPQASH